MVQGIVDTPDNLADRFGISNRLAIRVGALLGLGIQVTAAVLEEAANREATQEYLLSDNLFDAAQAGAEVLDTFLAQSDRFAVVATEDARVLALSEELLAARALPPALRKKAQVVHAPRPHHTRHLPFLNELLLSVAPDNDEVRRQKIRFLTAGTVEERLEALRRILMFPLDTAEKASVLFFALRDEEHSVIGEAVKAFKELGLDPGVADPLIRLIRGSDAARSEALDRLLRNAPASGPQESDVSIAVVGRLLRDEDMVNHKARLLKLLRSLLRGREGTARDIQDIVRLLTRNVPLDQEDAQLTLRELLFSIGKGQSDVLSDALWVEMETLDFGINRTLLLTMLGRTETRAAKLGQLDAFLLEEELSQALERGHDLTNYRFILARRYESLFPRLLDWACEVTDERRALLVRVLADALQDAEFGTRAVMHRLRALLALAERSGKTVRRVLLRSGLHQLPRLPATLRRRFAALFLGLLESEFFPEHNREVWNGLVDLNWEAVDTLYAYISEEANDPRLRRDSIELVREMLLDPERHPIDQKGLSRLARRFEKLAFNPAFSLVNDMGPLLGATLVHPSMTWQTGMRLATKLVRRLKKAYTPGDVAAMPFVARSNFVEPELKRRLVRRLLVILDEGEDAPLTREEEGARGTVIEMEGGSPIHTHQIPGALEALKEAALHLTSEDQGMAYMIVRTFKRTWVELSAWRKVWGLESRSGLVKALAEMAGADAMPPTLAAETFLFLVQEFIRRPFEPFLAEAVVRPLETGRFEKARNVSQKLLDKLLATAKDTESVGPDEAGRYLLAAARVVISPASPVAGKPGKAAASVLLDLLEKRAPQGFKPDLEAIRLLAETDTLPRTLRERATNMLGLVRRFQS